MNLKKIVRNLIGSSEVGRLSDPLLAVAGFLQPLLDLLIGVLHHEVQHLLGDEQQPELCSCPGLSGRLREPLLCCCSLLSSISSCRQLG